MTNDSDTPVVIEELVKVYRADRPDLAVRAVDGISFSVSRGDSLAILGPSGCGKSSLLHILGCLDRPTAGVYRLDGKDVTTMGEVDLAEARNKRIGFVFQSFNLLPRLNALENVELPLLYGDEEETVARATAALTRVGLAERRHHFPSELSGGQRQRVAIARALVTAPSILLCDEPTGALDSRTGAEILDLLLMLNEEGTTLIMVTHDLGVARFLKRAIALRDGRIHAEGDAFTIIERLLERQSADLSHASQMSRLPDGVGGPSKR